MNRRSIFLSLASIGAAFIGGFLLANAFNRNELTSLRSENERLASMSNSASASESSLTAGEIRDKIAEADQNPVDFQFQKGLGLSLYRYGAMKKDPDILAESARLLQRAADLNKNDRDVLVGLGNAYFDVGYFKKDNASLERSRKWYHAALEQRPDDVEVITDLGLTYFLQDPPEDANAVIEFKRTLAIDPTHEKTLQFLVQALLRQNDVSAAETFIAQLNRANPNNESLAELNTQLEESRKEPRK
ncbi:MAG: tetratricopeptide repeat protein [Pyrinomonadaceae bacterium]